MEYELKKKEILSQVEYTNLLSFSLVENKLQKNFRNIVEALMITQAKTDVLSNNHNQAKSQNAQQISKINAIIQKIQQQLNSIQSQQKNNQQWPRPQSSIKLVSQKEVEKMPSTKIVQKINNPSEDKSDLKPFMDGMEEKINSWQKEWVDQKAELLKQIDSLKDKLGSVGFLQNEFKSLKVDLKGLKQQITKCLKNTTNTSNKSLQRKQSILNTLPSHKSNDNLLQEHSKHTLKAIKNDPNKQNNATQNLEGTHHQQIPPINEQIQKQINSLYLELNTFKISFEELRDLLSDNRKQNYKNTNLISEVKEDLSREIKTRKTENQEFQKAIKDIKMQILSIQNTQTPFYVQSEQKNQKDVMKSEKKIKREDDDINFKNHLNDRISRLQGTLKSLITQQQLNQLKKDFNAQLQKLTKKTQKIGMNLESTQQKLEDLIAQNRVNTNSQISDLRTKILQISENIKYQASQNDRKNSITNARIQEFKKSLENLREDLEFYQSLMAENNNPNTKQNFKTEQNTLENHNDKKDSFGIDQKAIEALKKYFNRKMHDIRTNLLGLIRDLQKKLTNKSNADQELVKIWDKINEFNLFINKKADQEDTKKTFLYLQKKINRLSSQVFKNEDNSEDARIARTNWFCLSCDKNLQTYQGKIGKHVVWETMPLKGINKSYVNLHQEKKKGLPQLKK